MKVEAWIFGALTIFFLIVTPVYWFMTADPKGVPEITGTVALILTFFLAARSTRSFSPFSPPIVAATSKSSVMHMFGW